MTDIKSNRKLLNLNRIVKFESIHSSIEEASKDYLLGLFGKLDYFQRYLTTNAYVFYKVAQFAQMCTSEVIQICQICTNCAEIRSLFLVSHAAHRVQVEPCSFHTVFK